MTDNRPTAKIYRFPVKGTADGRDRLRDVPPIVTVASGSAWYHEEATRAVDKPGRA